MAAAVKVVLFLSGLACVSAAVVNLGCDPAWLIYDNNCYFIGDKKKVTWSEAINECNNYDSSPIFFEYPADLTWFKNITKQYGPLAYWTSMNDIANGDQSAPGTGWWMWGSHEYVDSTIIQWSTSPANLGRQACGGINQQGKMYDGDCNSKQGFMCMIDNGVTQNGGCPMGWLNTDTDCYYVSNTSDPAQLMTWKAAAAKCVQLSSNAHLFVLDDPNDQNFLINQLPYISSTTYLLWTGLQGSGQPGGWKWNNGATFNQQLFSWAVEPDAVAGKENCGVIRINGKFSDRGCNMKQNYICRKPEITTDPTWNVGCGLWTRAGSKCYVFYTNPISTWMDAKQTCQSMQGDLINVDNVDIKEWLSQQIMDPADSREYWTALNDRDTEGSYKWGDGSSLDSNTITWNHEPNDWMGEEDCAIITQTGAYNDITCTFHAVPICELDNIQSCPTTGGAWVSRMADSGSGQNCYLFGSYANSSLLKTQQEAADFCRSLAIQRTNQGGAVISLVPKLVAVNSQAEASFLTTQMKNYQDNQYGFWTSLNDKSSEGFWQFGNDPNSDTSFVNWNGEPNSATPDTDCVIVVTGNNFKVRKCGLKYAFICERPANTPWTTGTAPIVSSSLLLLLTSILCKYLI